MVVQQPLFTSPEELSFQLLSNLPFCPSKDLIALEDRYLRSLVHTLPGYDENDNDSEVVEKFTLDDSYFGKTQTILRDRDPKAIFNIRLSLNLPFPSEHDFPDPFRVAERVPYNLRRKYNFFRINVRLQARESVRNCMKYRNLSFARLSQLPHEVFLEILSHAHPIDLHALTAVNREFRSFFSSTTSNATWRKSFARSSAPTTPNCPTDVNGWEWATLFFGAPRCDTCRPASKAVVPVNPDVAFRKRLCHSCLYYRVKEPQHMSIHQIEQFNSVHDLVLKTFIRATPKPSDADLDYYLEADLKDVLQQYLRLQEDIKNGVDGAEDELKHYQTTRRAYVQSRLERVHECNEWLVEVHQYYRDTVSRRFNHQLTLIQKHLRQDGFEEVDIAKAKKDLHELLREQNGCNPMLLQPHKFVARYTKLTRSNWRKISKGYHDIAEGFAQRRIRKKQTKALKLDEKNTQEVQKESTAGSRLVWPTGHTVYGMNVTNDPGTPGKLARRQSL